MLQNGFFFNPEINNHSGFSKKNYKNRDASNSAEQGRLEREDTVKSKRLQTPGQLIIMQKQGEHSHYSSWPTMV